VFGVFNAIERETHINLCKNLNANAILTMIKNLLWFLWSHTPGCAIMCNHAVKLRSNSERCTTLRCTRSRYDT